MWNKLQTLVIQDKFNEEIFDCLWDQMDSITNNGTTVLHFSVIGCLDMTRYFLSSGFNPNIKNDYGETPLHWATQHNRIDQINMLIKFGANVNEQDLDKDTPLHWAAENDNSDAAKLLLRNGALINVKNRESKTPYKVAIDNFSSKCEELLQMVIYKNKIRKRKCLSANFSNLKVTTPIQNGTPIRVCVGV